MRRAPHVFVSAHARTEGEWDKKKVENIKGHLCCVDDLKLKGIEMYAREKLFHCVSKIRASARNLIAPPCQIINRPFSTRPIRAREI